MDQHSTSTGTLASSLAAPASAPRPPTDRELAILGRVLGNVQVEGADQLRDQLRMLQVAPGSDGALRIYLLHPGAPRAGFSRDGRTRLDSFPVRSPHGRDVGEVTVWVDHGHLRAMAFTRHDHRPVMTLPPPEWVEAPAPRIPAAAREPAALQSLAGVRTIGTAPVRDMVPAPTGARPAQVATEPAAGGTSAAGASRPRQLARVALAMALVASVVVLAVAAFFAGRSGGADLDAARASGAAAGSRAGAEHGELAGTFAGGIEGRLAGRASTYQASFESARASARTAARRRAAARERERAAAAAAAAAAAPPPGVTCPGYRDSRGVWVCA